MNNISIQSWEQVPFTKIHINDSFWRPRLEILNKVTLQTCLVKCEETGRISNFAKAAGLLEGTFEGIYFNDSDVYKILEGAAYCLMTEKDPALEAEIDRIINLVAAAQEKDGYLSTYFTLQFPDRKWTDMEKHEMYNGGHLIEAAVAYYEATGKRVLLDVACNLADHYDRLFGPGKRHWVEGHQEIELALVKLYQITSEERYLKLALWLLEERGHGHGVGMIWEKEEWGPSYCQDDVPVKEIEKVTGHAVRAMYMYTAMADIVHTTSNQTYLKSLNCVWEHTVNRNMYITGGIGPSKHNEGFTVDYDLPNESAYCETCAAIAMVFWNHRMNLLTGDSKYADIIEREMYNGVLSGISLSGDKFFYVNPLASNGEYHRVPWFDVSCCPSNLVRFLPSIGQYIYLQTGDGIVINQYINGLAQLEVGSNSIPIKISQNTNYPWDGNVEVTVEVSHAVKFDIKLRIPGWCKGYNLIVNGEKISNASATADKGYVSLSRTWNFGDKIDLQLDMPIENVRARSEVVANHGRVAIQRGPLVYCVEGADNSHLTLDSFQLMTNTNMIVDYRKDIDHGVITLIGKESNGNPVTFIPYFAWDNRDPGFMQVWIKEDDEVPLYIY
jgi:DUF1680 family protein